MCEKVSAADPPLKCSKDIKLFSKFRDCHRFMHFIMGLREDLEPTGAFLLSQSPTPFLDYAEQNTIIFLMWFAHSLSLPLSLNDSWVRLLLQQSTPLIIFLLLPLITNLPLNCFIGKSLTTLSFGFLVVLVSSPFLQMNVRNLSPQSCLCCIFGYDIT